MKILITTGLGKTDVGGPFQYAHNLEKEFQKLGHTVRVEKYGSVERSILRVLRHAIWADKILALDTFSVGLPSILWAKVFRRKIIIRVGGDFVWSAYVNRTEEALTLREFYKNIPNLNLKEKVIFFLTKWIVRKADFLAFNTEWQRSIWGQVYGIAENKSGIVRNFIPPKGEPKMPGKKNFLWAGRIIPEKNINLLKRVGERVEREHPEFRLDIITGESHQEVLDRIKECYAAISMAFSDICPNFIIEAASFNKPFVMTRETGLNEIFAKGGLFVDSLDEKGMGNTIKEMLDDNIYNKHLEELKSLNLGHSWREIAEELLEIWKK